MVKTVFGNEEGTILNNPTLKPGRHSFNFSYRLPPILPHSFDAGSAATTIGAVARIRYTARAKIDVHFGADIDSDQVEFLVEGLFDVNQAEGERGTHIGLNLYEIDAFILKKKLRSHELGSE